MLPGNLGGVGAELGRHGVLEDRADGRGDAHVDVVPGIAVELLPERNNSPHRAGEVLLHHQLHRPLERGGRRGGDPFRHGDGKGRFATWLSDRAFAVYVFHAPVLVALTPLLRPAVGSPYGGAGLLTFVGLAASFLVADLARRVPGLNRIL